MVKKNPVGVTAFRALLEQLGTDPAIYELKRLARCLQPHEAV